MKKSGITFNNYSALGVNDRGFRIWTPNLQMENYCDFMQKVCFLETKIFKKILDTEGCVLQLAIQVIPTI